MKKVQRQSVRLPAHVAPSRYRITIEPDLDNFTFQGQESISLNISKAGREITLHSKDLEIVSAEFVHLKKEVWAGKIYYNPRKETATLKFKNNMPIGKGELKLSFKGILNDKLRGFYRSSYLHKGEKKHLATTQFEATDARRAFPCFDEPASKAIFDVTLIVPAGLVAISNTVETKISKHKNGKQIVKFAPTPKMSTYLLAFIVGDFEFIESKTRQGVKVRVFTTPGKTHQAKFALDVATKTLSYFQKYFAIAYPLPSMDLIAIPDFAHGAMENWGAVTYRETTILVDSKNSSTLNKQHVAYVIAHELAHQWFGNLVTMEWWTHLWLNESFATYIGYLAIDELFPKWHIWTQFVYSDLGPALKLDSLNTTHAIEVEVRHPDEISEIFDAISYEKGASVIRMLADYLGEKHFRKGLQHYLTKHSYKSTSTFHLWQSFEEVSEKPVGKIMDAWIKKPGYPVISAKFKNNEIRLSQSRYFFNPKSKQKANDKTIWQVPLTFLQKSTANSLLLNKKTERFQVSKGFTKLNSGETGFYRTKYDPLLLKQLQKAIKRGELSPSDRLGILRDTFALAQSGESPTSNSFELLENYKQEENYTVWVEITGILNSLSQLIYGQRYYEKFANFAKEMLQPIIRKAGWEKLPGEEFSKGLLRALVLSNGAKFGHKKTIERARKIFWNYVNNQKDIDPDLRAMVYNTVAAHGSHKEYRALKQLYRNTALQEEKNRLTRALTCFPQKEILKKVLRFSISKEIRNQDTPGILSHALSKETNKNLTLMFIQENWKLFLQRYGEGGSMLKYLIAPTGGFHDMTKYKKFKKWAKKNPTPGANRMVTQILENIEGNALWLGRANVNIQDFLKNRGIAKAK